MTYPPQPGPHGPYGQQGHPGQQGYPGYHGQRAQHGQSHPGGYPAPQPGPGTPTGGYQSPQPPGPPPGPPRKNGKTGVIVGSTVALVLLAAAAVAVTGFWTPGYFLTDDTTSSEQVANAAEQDADTERQPPKPSLRTEASEPAPNTGSAEDVAIVRGLAEDAVTAINTRDADLARRISCQRDSEVDFSKLPKDTRVRMLGDPVVEGDSASVPFEITANGETHREPLTANRKNGSWCLG